MEWVCYYGCNATSFAQTGLVIYQYVGLVLNINNIPENPEKIADECDFSASISSNAMMNLGDDNLLHKSYDKVQKMFLISTLLTFPRAIIWWD